MNSIKPMLKIALGLMVGGVAAMAVLFTALGPIGPCLTESQTSALALGILGFASGFLLCAFVASRWVVRRLHRS